MAGGGRLGHDGFLRGYGSAGQSGPQDCDSAVCHRITFIYSRLYQHAQLDTATHDALHEMFGIANMTSLDHLAEMVRAGHVVTATGQDAYLPHLDRMAIPVTFIHGAENDCFRPESTAITCDALRKANPGIPYARHVLPGYGHIDCMFGRDASRDVYPRDPRSSRADGLSTDLFGPETAQP